MFFQYWDRILSLMYTRQALHHWATNFKPNIFHVTSKSVKTNWPKQVAKNYMGKTSQKFLNKKEFILIKKDS